MTVVAPENRPRERPVHPADDVLPAPTPLPVKRHRPLLTGAVLASAWVVFATALQLIRLPGRHPWQMLWAEDGTFFLPEALKHPLSSLLQAHAGYFQFVCRAIGSLATLVPIERAPLVFAGGGAFVAALVSVYVYVASAEVLPRAWARALMAALTVLAPAAVFEVSANGVDLHWYFLFACFWALWSTSERTPRLVADGLMALVATVSSPLAPLYAPLALRRFVRGSGWRRWVVPAAFGIGVVAQAAYVLTHRDEPRNSAFRPGLVPLYYAVRVAGSLVVGDGFLQDVWKSLGWGLIIGAVVVVAAVASYGLIVGRGRRLFIVAAVGYSAVLTLASFALRGTGTIEMHVGGNLSLNGSRYFFVPVLLLTAAFLAIAGSPRGPRWLTFAPAVLVAAVAAANVQSPVTPRQKAPDWERSVVAVRTTCTKPDQAVLVPITPYKWVAPLTCAQLSAHPPAPTP